MSDREQWESRAGEEEEVAAGVKPLQNWLPSLLETGVFFLWREKLKSCCVLLTCKSLLSLRMKPLYSEILYG